MVFPSREVKVKSGARGLFSLEASFLQPTGDWIKMAIRNGKPYLSHLKGRSIEVIFLSLPCSLNDIIGHGQEGCFFP